MKTLRDHRPLTAWLRWTTFGILILVALVPQVSGAVTADLELPPWFWRDGSWGVSTWGDYSTSMANFSTGSGSYTKLSNGNSFNVLETNYKARFAIHELVSIYGGVGYNFTTATDNSISKTNGQPTAVFAGADFIIPNRWIRLIPELEAGYPLYHLNINTTTPSTSDATTYFRVSMFFFKPIHFGRFVVDVLGHGGFYAPADNLAKLALFEAALEAPMGTMFALGGGVDGFATVISDSSTSTQRNLYSANANAGSFRYDAYNPSVLEAKGWLRFMPIPGLNFRLGYSKTLNGTNMANSQAITLAVAFNLPSIYGRAYDTGEKRAGAFHGPMVRPTVDDSNRLFEQNRVQDRANDSFMPDDHSEDVPGVTPAPKPPSDGGLGGAEILLEKKERGR